MTTTINVPSGLKFLPDDEELISFLFRRLNGPLSSLESAFMRDCNLYGNEEPWEIWERFSDHLPYSPKDLFFFTILRKKSAHGSNIIRRVGSSGGSWHGEDSSTQINATVAVSDGKIVSVLGSRKRFSYKNPNSSQNGIWIMHEYSIGSNSLVLCRLRKMEASRNKRTRQSDKTKPSISNIKKRKLQSREGETSCHYGDNGQALLPTVDHQNFNLDPMNLWAPALEETVIVTYPPVETA
ncbi:hypothetical protein K2173_002856 [Erythroxylum novogranatense]|uniref:NAC domain-containing protein n=1 Tax=Erythroxylum novogranatense TaxID=1862640 RepID=A0AAV8SQ85_9ROSI|nr:hypothetical protein K2173_002856 [Erythroxylum novogranatense]